eukprot:TRINITY_DN32336_c0_g1_i1.p1 TRINITY_DN32336_c0_g1~~TRINITY_DN32336_c0_g1_i1.p1  ORF type:complete len:380 (-),score=70.11 TRINITY_DN32336_c0_g1_i1:201-1340(-)
MGNHLDTTCCQDQAGKVEQEKVLAQAQRVLPRGDSNDSWEEDGFDKAGCSSSLCFSEGTTEDRQMNRVAAQPAISELSEQYTEGHREYRGEIHERIQSPVPGLSLHAPVQTQAVFVSSGTYVPMHACTSQTLQVRDPLSSSHQSGPVLMHRAEFVTPNQADRQQWRPASASEEKHLRYHPVEAVPEAAKLERQPLTPREVEVQSLQSWDRARSYTDSEEFADDKFADQTLSRTGSYLLRSPAPAAPATLQECPWLKESPRRNEPSPSPIQEESEEAKDKESPAELERPEVLPAVNVVKRTHRRTLSGAKGTYWTPGAVREKESRRPDDGTMQPTSLFDESGSGSSDADSRGSSLYIEEESLAPRAREPGYRQVEHLDDR